MKKIILVFGLIVAFSAVSKAEEVEAMDGVRAANLLSHCTKELAEASKLANVTEITTAASSTRTTQIYDFTFKTRGSPVGHLQSRLAAILEIRESWRGTSADGPSQYSYNCEVIYPKN